MPRHWLPAAAVIGAVLVAGTAACGGQGLGSAGSAPTTTVAPKPVQVSDVKTAMQNASAVHIKGTISDSGSNIVLDVQLNKAGTAAGTIGITGSTYPIELVGKVFYIQFTPDVMKSNGVPDSSAAGKKLENKWVPSTSPLLSGSDLTSSVQPLLDYTQFIGGIIQNMPSGTMKAGKSDVIDGTPVVLYTLSDGTPIDVATASPHYLIRLVPGPSDSGGSGQLDFTNWNQPVAVNAPPASEIYSG